MRTLIFGFALLTTATALGDEADLYLKSIKPVLQGRCYACHGVLKQEGGLRLDTAAAAVKGGDSGHTIKPGDVTASELVRRINSHDDADRMPPEGEPLKADEIAAITRWITEGAKAPANESPERDPRDHWAFQPPKRPQIPDLADDAWSKNPIDRFIAATHRQHGLQPQPVADRRIWLRRVTLDLTGLPPSREESDSFLADPSPDAYERVVNRLLDSPHYGERWGRHWMDIWRYSDWWGLGEESRNSQRHIWHWRDWIVESVNADTGYDQMLREMLAADELYPEDADKLRAGGYLGRQYFKFNRTSWMDETIEHTGKAMLGLTFNCSKCHDHKYDPFSQADYYRFRAIFEPYQVRHDATDGHVDFDRDGIPRPFDCHLDAKTYLHGRGDDRNPDLSRVMEPAVPAFLSTKPLTIEPVKLPPVAVQPGLRPFVVDAYLKQAEQRIAQRRADLSVAQQRLADAERWERMTASDRLKNDGKTLVRDDFSKANPDLWEAHDGTWVYQDGKLVQSQAGPIRAAFRLKQAVPTNFEVRLKLAPTGGETWKSAGVTFDGTDPNESLAYLSAYAKETKAQFAYRKGEYVYPETAMKPLPVDLGVSREMVLRVRGPLVNIAIDGEMVIAYRLPIARQSGPLQLITYDATADFYAFELRELSGDVLLVEPSTGDRAPESILPVEQAHIVVEIAAKALAQAEAEPGSIRLRSIADLARHEQPFAESTLEASQAAARAERIVAMKKADEELTRAKINVLRATTDKRTELETKLTAARTAFDAAAKAVDEPSESFTSLRGALKVLENNLETEESRPKPFPTTSTGRRTALAKWMTDRSNPLTARVAVNHLWSRHFGRALVPTVFDFGRKGAAPTHPELLDWLACEFMASADDSSGGQWPMKRIHRLLLTSSTYQMSSSSGGASPETRANDPDNRYFWRMNPIRMESQTVRDALLATADEIDFTMQGPPVPISNEASRRRSLYYFHSNIQKNMFLMLFDDASVLDCYRRTESIVPQQALALENSPLANDMALAMKKRIESSAPAMSDEEFVHTAFVMVLGFEPSRQEQDAVVEAMSRIKELAARTNQNDPSGLARSRCVHALFNHNDFVTIR